MGKQRRQPRSLAQLLAGPVLQARESPVQARQLRIVKQDLDEFLVSRGPIARSEDNGKLKAMVGRCKRLVLVKVFLQLS